MSVNIIIISDQFNAEKQKNKIEILSFLLLRNYGIDFRFSGNNGNIDGKARNTRYSRLHFKSMINSKLKDLGLHCLPLPRYLLGDTTPFATFF